MSGWKYCGLEIKNGERESSTTLRVFLEGRERKVVLSASSSGNITLHGGRCCSLLAETFHL